MDIVTFFLIWVCWGAIHGVLGLITLYNTKDRKNKGLMPESDLQEKLYDNIDEVGVFLAYPYMAIGVSQFVLSLIIGPFGTFLWIWEQIYTWVKG